MARRSSRDLEKITIRVNQGDSERLREYYPTLGYNEAIRRLVEHHLRQLDERTQRRVSTQEIKNPLLNEEDTDGTN
jgi:hypothetical protein